MKWQRVWRAIPWRRIGRLVVVAAVWLVIGGIYWFAGAAAWKWYASRPGEVMEEHISEALGIGCVTYKDSMHCVYLPTEVPGMGVIPNQ